MGNTDGKMERGGGAKDIVHFEHSFPAELLFYTVNDKARLPGEEGRAGRLELRRGGCAWHGARALAEEELAAVAYPQITELAWDHTEGGLRVSFEAGGGGAGALGLGLGLRSVDVEENIRLRCAVELAGGGGAAAGGAPPFRTAYMGVTAGATKPKPFQRKRPNLSPLPRGKLPELTTMRTLALRAARGCERARRRSRRPGLAAEALARGALAFPALRAAENGKHFNSAISVITLTYDGVELADQVQAASAFQGQEPEAKYSYDDIVRWTLGDPESFGRPAPDAPLELELKGGRGKARVVIQAEDAWYIRQALEFLHNRARRRRGLGPAPGTALGRAVQARHTLRGEERAAAAADDDPAAAGGVRRVVDARGRVLHHGDGPAAAAGAGAAAAGAAAAGSAAGSYRMEGFGPNGGSMKKSGSLRGVLSRKTTGSAHHVGGGAAAAADGAAARWEQQVVHNGWLWQRSGAAGPGRGAAWKRRHFALYALPVGHFLAAYKDPRHAPLFAPAGGGGPGPCLLVDLCKVNYLRPASRHGSRLEGGGGGADGGGVQAFDLITIEQEWTLSGDTEEASRRWLRLLTLCVDRDVAVAPDDRAAFQAKMKVEQAPKGQTTSYANGTAQFHPVILKVSASGVEMMSKDTKASDEGIVVDHRENIICTSSLNQFWCYTDFFKWSVVYKKEKNKEKRRARGLMLHVFTDTSFHNKFVLYFKTKAATELATTIEFHIEKFMARMHLRKELEVGEEDLNSMYAGENFTSLPPRSRESTREEEPPSPEVLSSDEEDESSDDERPDGTTNINKQRNSFNSMDNRSSAGSVSEDEANTKAKDPVDLLDLSSTREEANTNIPQQPTLLFSEEEVVLPTPVQEPDELLQSRKSTPNILDGVQHQQHDLKQHQPSLGGSGKSPAEGDLLSSAKPFQAGPMSNLPLPPNQKDDLNPFSFPTVSNTNIFPRPGAAHLRRRRRTLLLGGPTLARGALLEPRDDGGGGGGLRVLWDASAPGPGPGAVAVRVTVEHATAAAAAAALVVDGVGLEGTGSGLRYSIQRLGQHTNERVTLNPGESFSFLLEMQVLAPFRRSPSLVLSLSRPPAAAAATPPPPPPAALLRLATPVTLGHFLRPAPLGRRAFAEKWARLRAPGQERVEVVRWAPAAAAAAAAPRWAGEEEGERPPPPPPPPLGPRAVADRARACLGLAAVADVGAPPETLAALAGVLHTAAAAAAPAGGGGGGVAVGALVRLEFAPRAPNAVRVTIRTTHPLVTEALMECFKELLEENDEEEEEEDIPA